MTTYLDSIVLLDFWVGETDGSSIMSHNIGNFVLAETLALHFTQFETCLLSVDTNWLEASLDVVHNAEVFAGFRETDDVLETKWEAWISSYFVVHLDISISVLWSCVSADFHSVLAGERVFKSVLEQSCQRDALSQLVWACRWAGCVHACQLVQAPVRWCPHSFHMLPGSSSLKNRKSKN